MPADHFTSETYTDRPAGATSFLKGPRFASITERNFIADFYFDGGELYAGQINF